MPVTFIFGLFNTEKLGSSGNGTSIREVLSSYPGQDIDYPEYGVP
jgi:hypothetical protein